MSVTPFGIVGALARSIDPGVGHWPAIAGVAKADAAAMAMAAVASLVVKLNIAVSLKRFEICFAAEGRTAGCEGFFSLPVRHRLRSRPSRRINKMPEPRVSRKSEGR